GVGIGTVMPTDDNGSIEFAGTRDLDVANSTRPTLTFEYFIADNLGIEVLAATPFDHDIDIEGGFEGSVRHLPPTVSLLYHVPTGTAFTPIVGIGVNYTTFWDESLKAPLNGADLELEDSWGIAATVGVDYAISDNSAIRANARYIDIDSDVKVNGTKVGEANIDPWVFGVSYIYKF
ncbi:MAG: OmpW family outer membrane protein, partial [Pseudomonadota bacterium]